MAEAQCKISFKIDYTSSSPIEKATAYYGIMGHSPAEYQIPDPESNKLVELPIIQAPGNYDLTVKLDLGNVSAQDTSSFKIGKCIPSSCKVPSIDRVLVDKFGQVEVYFSGDDTDLATLEYQIALDPEFKNIIYSKVGLTYAWPEYVDMNTGKINNNTLLYIRARKYCLSNGVSDWSGPVEFQSGEWKIQEAPYSVKNACCVSASFKEPTNPSDVGESICQSASRWTKSLNLTTPFPQIGSFIYLEGGRTPAIPGNLSDFDENGATGFNENGILWVRFPSYSNSKVYDVKRETGEIIGESLRYIC
ncbi:hypothetical protein HNP24_001900 [Chryseobacterium sediminis]|uniref:Uncharacterized protein n=1 Tax=Chryseobacterium sediminis TaxID=1679494 RepID=A0ABR6PZ04_9FLAO|nr:hypothetical protein [Chryseobacterium sediminis]MBB6330950.1 hypothetical protein [Chryseobacterium sediminis]